MAAQVHSHSHDIAVPRGPLLAIGALLAAVVVAVAGVRLWGGGPAERPAAPVLAERALFFTDQPDGSVLVHDAAAGPGAAPVARVAAGGDGFLRGALRALVRTRRLAGLDAQTPFHLAAHGDGRLTLRDPATGQRVDLESFGPTNAAVFARLLAPPR